MRRIETLPIIDAEILRLRGKLIFLGELKGTYKLSEQKLQKNAETFGADVVGISSDGINAYRFYRSNFAQENEMELSKIV